MLDIYFVQANKKLTNLLIFFLIFFSDLNVDTLARLRESIWFEDNKNVNRHYLEQFVWSNTKYKYRAVTKVSILLLRKKVFDLMKRSQLFYNYEFCCYIHDS